MTRPDCTKRLRALLDERILVLDGASGTAVQAYGLSEAEFRGERFADHPKDLKGNNDILALTRPDVFDAIHESYLAAGADIIETNTFNGTAISQADYGTEACVYDMNKRAAEIARAACDRWNTPERPRFVAGSLGPSTTTLSLSPDVNDPAYRAMTFEQVHEAYAEQARGLVDGGVDMLFLETIIDTLVAKAALCAIADVLADRKTTMPLCISVTVTDKSGRTLSGQTVDAFWASVRHMDPLILGINCSLGARDMRPYLAELARIVPTYLACYPNAGLPNAFGEYDEHPDETSTLLAGFARDGLVNLVGGCCGTTAAHIEAIAKRIEGLPPRVRPRRDRATRS